MVSASTNFMKVIEKMVKEDHITYYEAVMEYMERHEDDIEPETIAVLINRNALLKSKIQEECEDLALIEKSGRLPI